MTGAILIVFSALISFVLSTTVDMTHHELGALVNYIWPPVIGLVTLLFFLMATWITKNRITRIVTLALCCLYNVYVGFALHIEKDYWPLVTF